MKTSLHPMRTLLGMVAVLCGVMTGTAAPQPRLGIVHEAPELLVAADLVTAAWTRDGSVELVERADISRILKEQALTAGQTANYVKMGQLLSADGLLLFQLLVEGTNRTAVARLIAVKPGVVLGAARSAFPITNALDWGSAMVARFKPLLPKLAVLPKDAVPISLLNIRAASTGPDTSELERQLTALLYLRLMAERDVFILERQRMESLTWEKSLKGVDETAFWTGSYLLDGSIDRDGTRSGQVTVHLRLAPPKDGQPVVILAEGKRDRPGDVIEKLIPRILEALKKRTAAPAWNADQEAAKFLGEARWAHRWGMYHEAQVACEAAWALGSRNGDTATLRIYSYIDATRGDVGWLKDLGRHALFATKPPPPDALDMTLRGLDLYDALAALRSDKEEDWDFKRQSIGLSVMERVSELLRHYYFNFRARLGQEDKLSAVRDRTRRLAAGLETGPIRGEQTRTQEQDHIEALEAQDRDFERRIRDAEKDLTGQLDFQARTKRTSEVQSLLRERNQVSIALAKQRQKKADARHPKSRSSATLDQLEFRYGAFWYDSPQEALTLYRNCFTRFSQPEQLGDSLQQAERLFRSFDAPWLVTWNPAERGQKSVVWETFIKELLASTNSAVRLHGSLLRLQMHYPIAEGPTHFSTTRDGRRVWITPPELAPDAPLQPDVEHVLVGLWNIRDLCRSQAVQPSHRLGVYTLLRRILRYWSHQDRHPLESKLDEIETQLSQYQTMTDLQEKKPYNPLQGGSPPLGAKPSPSVAPTVSQPAPETLSSPSLVARRWKCPLIKSEAVRNAESPMIESIRFKQGKLWVALSYGGSLGFSGFTELHALVRVDPETLQSEMVLPAIPPVPGRCLAFDVEGNDLFLVDAENRVNRQDMKTGAQRNYEVPFPGSNPPVLSALDEQLFVCALDRIVQLNLQDGQVQLLASNRRQPPETVLDGTLNLNASRVFKLPDGRFGVMVADRTYAWDAKARNWLALGAGQVEARALASVELLQAPWWYPQTVFPHPQFLALLRGEYRGPVRWSMAGSVTERIIAGSFDGTHMALIVAQGQRLFDGSRTEFWYLHPRWAEPFLIPLSSPVGVPANTGSKPSSLLQFSAFDTVRLVMTPSGVILTVAPSPSQTTDSFWFISKKELEEWVEDRVRTSPPRPMDESAKPSPDLRDPFAKRAPDELIRQMQEHIRGKTGPVRER